MEVFYDGTFLDRVIIVICLIGALAGATFVVYLLYSIVVWIIGRLREAIDWFGHISGW